LAEILKPKMSRHTLITFTLLLWGQIVFAQKNLIELDIHDKKVSYFINLEKKMGGAKFNTGQNYISGGQVAQPEIFTRTEKNIPDLLVYYTFFKTDSTISEILYEWDVKNFDPKDNNQQSIEFEKNLILKYNQVVDFVSKKYGKSKSEGDLNDLNLINVSKGLQRNDTWQPNDSLKIYSYIDISNFYKKDKFVTVNPTHKIRVYVYNLKEEKSLKLNPTQIKSLDTTFKEFLTLLSADSFEEIKKLFSSKIVKTATNDVLKQVKENLKLEKKLELYMNGMQILQDGNSYPMLQYKYSDDTSSPPKEYIMVLFDDENKILGLRPMKRQ
jgi:hypothetical protein